MPQAPQYLRDLFDDDIEAWKVLGNNFQDNKGVISRKDRNIPITEQQGKALDYLWLEWDYSFEEPNQDDQREDKR